MFYFFASLLRRRKNSVKQGLDPDEIFLDSSNLPQFDTNQFEGRIEKPIKRRTLIFLGGIFLVLFSVVSIKAWQLQIVLGDVYAAQSEENRLHHSPIFADRGVIYDRNRVELAWNVPNEEDTFARRLYPKQLGLAHVLGYVNYPLKDSHGIFYQDSYVGKEGVEKSLNYLLGGINGLKIVELDAEGGVQSESTIRAPQSGKNVILTIDARVQEKLYQLISEVAVGSGFIGGGGALMDVSNGEILALTSFPQYDSSILSNGKPEDQIEAYISDSRKPFLNRITQGLFTPGSIIKPFLALGALHEGVITPEKEIVSTGSISIPNPYSPNRPSVFRDWKAHGSVDMRKAIGVSSDVYFYEIGGGFGDQPGLGIERIEQYARLFGLGMPTGIALPAEAVGIIPNPAWKEKHFEGDPWRIGDTYNTAIGQYGFQVTPLEALRGIAAVANGGRLLTPKIQDGVSSQYTTLPLSPEHFDVVHEGMRYAVTNGTALGLYFGDLEVAAKTGTAEVGVRKEFVNSWVIGFLPYENPHYAFVVIMERAPSGTLIGAVSVMQRLLSWMKTETPEYVTGS